MTGYVAAALILVLGSVLASFTAWDSFARAVRPALMLAPYPLFLAMLVTHGPRVTALVWIVFAAAALLLELIADALTPAQRQSMPRHLRTAALMWPLAIPAASESILIRLGFARPPPDVREMIAPILPRGDALAALPDDEMLVAAHTLLSGSEPHSPEERTIFAAETFNREMHAGGIRQWLANADHPAGETADALDAVGARRASELARRAARIAPPASSAADTPTDRLRAVESAADALGWFDDEFYALERSEDLTSHIAGYLRRHLARCPSLEK